MFAGLDIRQIPLLDVVSCRRMDVHCIDLESVCHISGPLRGRHSSSHLSKHYVDDES